MIVVVKRFIRKHKTWLIPLLFILMSFMGVAYLWHFHIVYFNSDYTYHLGRIESVKNSIINHTPFNFNIGGTTPYGLTTAFYPWLTLIPFIPILILIHNGVDVFYTIITVVMLTTYLISYYSYHTYDKSWLNDFIFATFYTNSSVLFDWAFRAGDIGSILAAAYLPLALLGLLKIKNHHKGFIMLFLGLLGILSSHVITGCLGLITILGLWILDIKGFHFKDSIKVIISFLLTILATSIFWVPVIHLFSCNEIVMPSEYKELADGFVRWIGSHCNYLYDLACIIGIFSILCIKHKGFKWMDFLLWLVTIGCLLFNISAIAGFFVKEIPKLLQLQFAYRTGLISNLTGTFLATKWLTGKYNTNKYHVSNLVVIILTTCLILTPITNEISFHFLMSRPIVTASNISTITKHSHTPATPYDFDAYSYKTLNHHHYSYDYAPNKQVPINAFADNNLKFNIYNRKGKWLGIKKYTPQNNDILIDNRHYANIQYPIALYHGVKYTFNLNGHKMSDKYINKKITEHRYELTLHNLPQGKNKINIRTAKIKLRFIPLVKNRIISLSHLFLRD